MFRIFTKSRGIFFYSLLAFLLWGYEVGACIDAPDIIKLPGSTFVAETITIETSKKVPGGAFKITFGKTAVSHNGTCWFYHKESKCLSQVVPTGYHVAIKKNGKEIGLLKFDDKAKTLHAYSISKPGVKDPDKPYLAFRTAREVCRASFCTGYDLTVTAHEKDRVIGRYHSTFRPDGPIARNLEAKSQGQKPFGILNLRGKEFSSQGCHVKVKPI